MGTVTRSLPFAALALVAALGCHVRGPSDAGSAPDATSTADMRTAADGTGAVDAAGAAETDAADATDAAGIACGDGACAPGQVCVEEICGGGPVRCVAPGDGGQCAVGWTFEVITCAATGQPGCWPPPCQSPPPHCADVPAACHGHLDCSCVPSTICDGIPCAGVLGMTIECAAQ
jgi:hypothetical protein